VRAHADGGRGSEPQMLVTISTPINSRQYSSCAAHDREKTEGTRRQCPYFRRRVGLSCAAVEQRALGYAQVTAGGVRKVSL
jgi:hypothetical protein